MLSFRYQFTGVVYLKSKFSRYYKIALSNGLSGSEIAGKYCWKMWSKMKKWPQGKDSCNTINKTANLSPEVHNGTNISAVVGAGKWGHHSLYPACSMLMLCSKLIPIVLVSTKPVSWILINGQTVLKNIRNPKKRSIYNFISSSCWSKKRYSVRW